MVIEFIDICRGDEVYASACSIITPPFVAVIDSGVVHSYVWVPEDHGDVRGSDATFQFKCSSSTIVAFKMEGIAPTRGSNSFFMKVDQGSEMAWDFGSDVGNNWRWRTFNFEYQITEGPHELHVIGREDGTKMRRVGFVKGQETCNFYSAGMIAININFLLHLLLGISFG